MTARVAIVTVSDRASRGLYDDKGGPAAEDWIRGVVTSPLTVTRDIIPDGHASVAACLRRLVDEGADLILVTGGTGPAPRDETPEGMAQVIDKELAGFGEEMRRASLREVPTAILSRQSAGIAGKSLIITLPGKPAAIATCLNAVFAAVPYCLDLIGAARIETDPSRIAAFRPKA
ncbi:molybdopterin adenylyltransferase [Rhodobacter veldkampii DSM 11550]|uniref:Molybdopterin adenylyltransferase n=1 Tax=Phaeovulum veldkampii DSM 11550 TaxID=1185920 RepID=A0A2T4JLD6_9RHOB|nr:molybdopterin adenylyltransferase [Phaeovulum veldkampii]MBK5947086.1 molybdopterin adenylyltransferase [Phaeovulum veldkampii DSM 11550]PTE18698.1 molybdopterin adenylyltransferase [Phaeovulum veldkampii DSM 11550]TDQ54153.1 molybdopterin adenylyltransferase [Phaeovulum veldkampii DSM 11550]